MKTVSFVILAVFASAVLADESTPRIAGSTSVAVAVAQERLVALGWSVKRQILGRTVLNDAGDKVGTIDDLIVAPDSAVSLAIVGVGGFVGVRSHRVAVPVGQLVESSGKFVLPGATKEMLKATPKFDYAE